MRRIIDIIAHTNPWLVFLPVLALYIVLALKMTPHDIPIMDEGRYLGFAENMLHGHYHYKEGYQFLWSGPGYPIILLPFVALGSPLWPMKLLNALLLYTSVVTLLHLLRLYVSPKQALLGATLFAFYYPMYVVGLPYVMTESWSMFLIVMATYVTCKAFRFKDYRWRSLLLPGFLFGMLALTKVIFGYVLLAMILICLGAFLIRGRRKRMFRMAMIWVFALVTCLPYLAYTYSLTNKPFYWGNSGGLQLYWMSTPYENELGDWHVPTLMEDTTLMKNHGAFFASIENLSPLEQDQALTQQAIANIKAHPKKYAYNWIANLGRTFFSHPLSFLKPSNGLFAFLVPNIFLIVFAVLMAFPTLRFYKKFPLEVLVMLVFSLVYLGGISLMASYPRFLFLIIPIWITWIGWGLHRFVKVNFGHMPEANQPQPLN